MGIMRWMLREVGVLLSFSFVASLLLISLWVSGNVNSRLNSDFRHDQVSVVIESGAQADFRNFLQGHSEVIQYKIYEAFENKNQVLLAYPELRPTLESLEDKFFPVSAVVTVEDGARFAEFLRSRGFSQSSILSHEFPTEVSLFVSALAWSFFALWVLGLVVALYLQIDRLAYLERSKWSLLKMLGAKPSLIFWPICWRQILRTAAASLLAVGVAYGVSVQFDKIFAWQWPPLSVPVMFGFVLGSVAISASLMGALFMLRYQKVSVG